MAKTFEVAFELGAKLTNSFKEAFGGANKMLGALGTAAAAVGGVSAFGAMIEQVDQMTESMNVLKAQTGLVGEEAKQVQEAVKNLYRDNYGESFEELALAAAKVKQNMHNLDNGEIERVTGDAISLAKYLDSDVNEVTHGAQNLMDAFGATSTHVFDLFAKGAQSGLNLSNDMFDQMSEFSAVAKQAGYTIDEYFGLMQRGAANGVYNLDRVNNAILEFGLSATDGSKSSQEAFSSLSGETQKLWQDMLEGKATAAQLSMAVIKELQAMDDQTKANQIGTALWKTVWEDNTSKVMYSMFNTNEAMKDFEGTMESINELRFDSFGGAIQGIGRILFMDLVVPIGESVLPHLNDFANFLRENLPQAIDSFKESLKIVLPILSGVTAGLLGFQVAVLSTKAVSALGAAITFLRNPLAVSLALTQMLAAAQTWLNTVLLANPLALVVGLLAGLGVAFYTAYKTSDVFKEKVDAAFSRVKDVVSSAVEYVSSVAPSMWDRLVSSVQGVGEKIANFFGEGLTGGVGSVVSGFIEQIKAGFSSGGGIISLIAPTITTVGLSLLGVSGPIGIAITAVVSLMGTLYRLSQTNEGVRNALATAWTTVQDVITSVLTSLKPVFDIISQSITQTITTLGPAFQETGQVIIDSIVQLGPTFAELGTAFGELFKTWFGLVSTIATTVFPLLANAVQTIFPLILSIVQAAIPLIIQIISMIIPVIMDLAIAVIPLILQVVQAVFPVVLTIIQTVLPIVVGLLAAIIPVVMLIVQTVIPLILQVVQMVFPLVLSIIQAVIPIITMILEGVSVFISTVLVPTIEMILQIVQFVFPIIMSVIQTAMSVITGILQTATALLKGDWEGAWNSIKSTAKTIMDGIISFLESINLFETGKKIMNGLKDGIVSAGNSLLSGVGTIVNGVIKGLNWVTGKMGIGTEISLWTIPQYATGTDGHPGGPAILGDGGQRELFMTPDGRMGLSPATDTLMNLPKGSQVLPGRETSKILGVLGGVPAYKEGIGNSIKDIWSLISDPSSLLDKVLTEFGVKVPDLSGSLGDIAKGVFSTIKDKASGFLKGKLDGLLSANVSGGAGVQRWAGLAAQALRMVGQYSESNLQRMLMQMDTESSGNPRAINLWDSNAKKGIPSKGLMQVIDPTFRSYALPGFDKNIYDPLSNMLASIRYSLSRYGSLARAWKGHGYADGGIVSAPELALVGEGGDTESIIPWNSSQRSFDLWRLTGEKIGALQRSKNEGALSPLNVPLTQNASNEFNNGKVEVKFENHVTIQGNADKNVIQQALTLSQADFERMLENYINNKNRISFG